jgi:hypothetical protein
MLIITSTRRKMFRKLKIKLITILILTIAFLGTSALILNGQEINSSNSTAGGLDSKTASSPASAEFRKWDVYSGYSFMRFNHFKNLNGFEVATSRNLSRFVGLKFDISGSFSNEKFIGKIFNTTTKRSIYNVLGGVQIKDNSARNRFKPFTHALIGINTYSSEFTAVGVSVSCAFDCSEKSSHTGFSFVIGGGIDIKAGNRFDIRVVQVDYNRASVTGDGVNNFRIGAGIVIH